jgi:RimJ/RimL family protein N-acetyltransferase
MVPVDQGRSALGAGPAGRLTGVMHLTDERTLRLRDGRLVAVRPIRPTDAEPLREFDGGLSDASRCFRYLGWLPRMSREESVARAAPDGQDTFVLVATGRQGPCQRLVAECQMARDVPGTVEIAVSVAEDYRAQGLGPALIRLMLVAAATHGVSIVAAQVRADNAHMIHVLRALGFRQEASDLGIITFAHGAHADGGRHAVASRSPSASWRTPPRSSPPGPRSAIVAAAASRSPSTPTYGTRRSAASRT